MFQPPQIFIVRRATRADATVFWVTLISALFLKLDTAIFTGIGISLVLFLQKAGTPSLLEHAFDEEGQLTEIAAPAEENAMLATKRALERAQALIGVEPELRVFYRRSATAGR